MQRTFLALIFGAVMIAHGSLEEIRAVAQIQGTQEAFAVEQESRARLRAAEQSWRDSKKLTVMDKPPEQPCDIDLCLSLSDLKSDLIGYLEYWQFEVLQITGPKDLLLGLKNPDIPCIWLTGHSTHGLADGDKVRLCGLVEIDGTKTYTSLLGVPKTVRVVRLVSRERIAEMEVKAEIKRKTDDAAWAAVCAETEAKAKAQALAERLRKYPFRTWSDKTGKYTIQATFRSYGGGKVTIQTKDGRIIKVPAVRLGKEDQDYVKGLKKQHDPK